jgi:hypothetical protein
MSPANTVVSSKVNQPIFIVGCGRSGTSLLFDILSTHPDLVRTTGYPDGEDHEGWIKYGKCVMAGIGNSNHSKYGNGINGQQYCLHMSKEDVTDNIVCDMHAYYWKEVLDENSSKRAINKQPHLSNKLDYLLQIFPDAKIVHIVRDCEPMVASWLAVMDDHPSLVIYWPKGEEYPCLWLMTKPDDEVALNRLARHSQFFPGGGSELFVDYWCKVNLGIKEQMVGKESQLLTVRYEDLVTDPLNILDKISSFCELSETEFGIDLLQKNTAQKHRHLISPEMKELIVEKTKLARIAFGYEPGINSGLTEGLFMQ